MTERKSEPRLGVVFFCSVVAADPLKLQSRPNSDQRAAASLVSVMPWEKAGP